MSYNQYEGEIPTEVTEKFNLKNKKLKKKKNHM